VSVRDIGQPHGPASEAVDFYVAMMAYADWVGALQAIAWPLMVLVALAAIASSPSARASLGKLGSRITGIQFSGFQIALTPESATRANETVTDTFAKYRTTIKARFDALARRHDLDRLLERIAHDHIAPNLSEEAKQDYRATIHVADVLFEDGLYQLVDYYPGGGGRGRAFSIRIGIIGKTWRSGASQDEPNVNPGRDDLVNAWAMTEREADQLGKGRRSFLCTLLVGNDRLPVAILYVDSPAANAFNPHLAERIENACRDYGLTQELVAISREMRSIGPVLPIFDHI